MDSSMTHVVFSRDASQSPLIRFMARCIPSILFSGNPRSAQSIIQCIQLLRPDLDVRRFQGLYHHVNEQYVEAMQIFGEIEGPEAKAFMALGLRAIGEASWWSVAQQVYESGHPAAIAILDPWVQPPVQDAASDTPGPEAASHRLPPSLRA